MSWNYRIVKNKCPKTGEIWYGLHEVYYDEQGLNPSPTVDPISFSCDEEEGPEEGIVWSIRRALHNAINKPVLDFTVEPVVDVPFGGEATVLNSWKELAIEARNRLCASHVPDHLKDGLIKRIDALEESEK